jgi:hypothetical protein
VTPRCRDSSSASAGAIKREVEQKMGTTSLVPAGRGFHNKIKTHCPKGHPLSGDNLYVTDGGRGCRLCRQLRNQKNNRSKRIAKRTKAMIDTKAQLVLIALRKGRTLNSICGGRLNGRQAPGEKITDHCLFQNYCADHPEYSREANALLAENTKLAAARKGAPRRSLTHCKHGHPLSGDNLYLPPGRWQRQCWTCIKRRDKAPPPPTQEQIRQVTAALNRGKTIGEICWGKVSGQKVGKAILTFRKLKLHRDLNPDFDRFVVSAMADHNSKGQLRRFNPNRARAEIIRAETNDFYRIRAMLPAAFPDKDDVVSAIFEDLLTGTLKREEVKARVQSYITAHNRMFPTKFAKFGDSPLLSLDEVLFDDGTATRGDSVSRGLWD